MEFKNFKRYALLYGLEFNCIGCKLSYVKTVDRKDNELYHLIRMLGLKVRKYHGNDNDTYVPHLKYGEPTDIPYPKDNEKTDKLKYSICPYRFALESVVQGRTIYRERFLIIFYMRVILQSAIQINNAGHRISEKELRDIIIKEYQNLDDKFKISNEYEKSQIISELYRYLSKHLKKYGSFTNPSDTDKLRDDFLVVKLDEFIKKANGLDLNAVMSNAEERYKDNRGKHCMYCSSRDVCLRIAQN